MTFSWRRTTMQWALALLVVYAWAAIAILMATGITVEYARLSDVFVTMIIIAVIVLVMSLIMHRLAGDDDKIARNLCRTASAVSIGAQVGGYIVLMSMAGALLSYLVVTAHLPLFDVQYAAMDQALGFNWLGFLETVNDRPWLAKFLTVSYFSSTAQVGLLIVVLSWLGQVRNLQQYLAIFAITAGAVLLFSGLFPSYGPYHFYNPALELSSNLSQNAGRYHIEAYHMIYTGKFTHFDWATTEGIVSFPSFHTVMAMITAYCMREVRYLAWPMYALGLVISISTMPEGGHYLVDVLSGAVIALVAIYLVRHIDGQRTRIRDLFPALPAPSGGERSNEHLAPVSKASN